MSRFQQRLTIFIILIVQCCTRTHWGRDFFWGGEGVRNTYLLSTFNWCLRRIRVILHEQLHLITPSINFSSLMKKFCGKQNWKAAYFLCSLSFWPFRNKNTVNLVVKKRKEERNNNRQSFDPDEIRLVFSYSGNCCVEINRTIPFTLTHHFWYPICFVLWLAADIMPHMQCWPLCFWLKKHGSDSRVSLKFMV